VTTPFGEVTFRSQGPASGWVFHGTLLYSYVVVLVTGDGCRTTTLSVSGRPMKSNVAVLFAPVGSTDSIRSPTLLYFAVENFPVGPVTLTTLPSESYSCSVVLFRGSVVERTWPSLS
jgi:hypothetical protein